MKELRFLLFGMAICLVSGVKAQFYDGPDDIYYYVRCDKYGQIEENGEAVILNFDGKTACVLAINEDEWQLYPPNVNTIKEKLSKNINYLQNRIETGIYDTQYVSGNTYKRTGKYNYDEELLGYRYGSFEWTLNFSSDRKTLNMKIWSNNQGGVSFNQERTYKQVDRSFFKVGRSRTPSSTLHE